jgi:LEA14-like dessication related protein
MTRAFDELRTVLKQKGKLTLEDIEEAVKEHGEMTEEEKVSLAAEAHVAERKAEQEVTVEQYIEATKTLETAEEGSPEYKEAQEIVEAFETGA